MRVCLQALFQDYFLLLFVCSFVRSFVWLFAAVCNWSHKIVVAWTRWDSCLRFSIHRLYGHDCFGRTMESVRSEKHRGVQSISPIKWTELSKLNLWILSQRWTVGAGGVGRVFLRFFWEAGFGKIWCGREWDWSHFLWGWGGWVKVFCLRAWAWSNILWERTRMIKLSVGVGRSRSIIVW